MKPYKVSEINKYINRQLSTDFLLSDISIEGEVSNFTHHFSGHMYFNLKDENSRLKCVMFESDNLNLDLELEDGRRVIARGNIGVYERDGLYQLYVKELEESGLGDLYKEFIELKEKLDGEGLFDEKHKKDIPERPKKIGVVTSSTGAAIKDIITVVDRRFPITNILLYPALVQGDKAVDNIIAGLKYLDSREDVDLIIFGRGGGSSEELFIFNNEELARTVYELKTPNISAIGHEVDFTIADFVSDLRAATPSAAAEIAVPDLEEYLESINNRYNKIVELIKGKLVNEDYNLKVIKKEIKHNEPSNKLMNDRQRLDNVFNEFLSLLKDDISDRKSRLNDLNHQLNLLDPRIQLDKGHGILIDKDGNYIKSIDNINQMDRINIIMKDGSFKAEVLEVEKVEENEDR